MKVSFTRRAFSVTFCGSLGLVLASLAAPAPTPPPGYNVHLVQESQGHRFWRGGGPRRDTLEVLAASARERGVSVTLVDLRHPANADDRSGKQGKLSPQGEAALAQELGLQYLSISALDRKLTPALRKATSKGDVYIHCMYGVNRTGFAVARYARDTGVAVNRTGLGPRDWRQGDAFQARLQGNSRPGPKPSHAKPQPQWVVSPPTPAGDTPGELAPTEPPR